jgi:hypothetical protein
MDAAPPPPPAAALVSPGAAVRRRFAYTDFEECDSVEANGPGDAEEELACRDRISYKEQIIKKVDAIWNEPDHPASTWKLACKPPSEFKGQHCWKQQQHLGSTPPCSSLSSVAADKWDAGGDHDYKEAAAPNAGSDHDSKKTAVPKSEETQDTQRLKQEQDAMRPGPQSPEVSADGITRTGLSIPSSLSFL